MDSDTKIRLTVINKRIDRIDEILQNLEPLLMTMGQVQDEIKSRLTRLEREKVYR